jgi:hypothetical protein
MINPRDYSGTFSMYRAIPQAMFSVVTFVALVAVAAAAPKIKNADSTTTGTDPVAKKLGTQLQVQFKLWDHDKDDYVTKEELHKAFGKGKAHRKGAEGQGGAPPLDPQKAATSLMEKADKDGDGQISHIEFNDWAGRFSSYAVKYIAAQNERMQLQQQMMNAESQRRLGRARGVAAANNRQVNNTVNQLEKNYQNELKRVDKDLINLDADPEHADYRDVLFARLVPKQHAE